MLPSGERDYSYDSKYEQRPEQRANQNARHRARYELIKKYGERVLAGKDVDHKLSLEGGGSNAPSNLRLRSIHANRGDKTFS